MVIPLFVSTDCVVLTSSFILANAVNLVSVATVDTGILIVGSTKV